MLVNLWEMEFLYNKGSRWLLKETRKWPVKCCDHKTGATLCWLHTHGLTWIRSHTSVVTTPGSEEATLPLFVSPLSQLLLCQPLSLCSVMSLLAPAMRGCPELSALLSGGTGFSAECGPVEHLQVVNGGRMKRALFLISSD